MAGERKLLVKLLGDSSGLHKAFGEAETSSTGFMGKIQGGLAAIPTPLMVGATALAGLGGAAFKFAGDFADSAETAAKETSKLMRLTGGTAEDMSRMRFIAQQTGTDVGDLGSMFVKLSKNALGPAGDELKAMGVNLTDSSGKALPFKDVLSDIAGVFSDMPGGMERTALATKIFGKSGADLLPFLTRGEEGLAALAEKSDKFGYTIGQDTVDGMKKHVAAQRDLTAMWEGVKIQLGEKLMPIMTKAATFLSEHMPAAIQWAKDKWAEFGPKVTEVMQQVADKVGPIVEKIVGFFRDHGETIIKVMMEVLSVVITVQTGIWDVVGTVVGWIVDAVEWMVNKIQAFWEAHGAKITATVIAIWDMIVGIFNRGKDMITRFIELIKDLWHGKWGEVWDDIKGLFKAAWDNIVDLVTGVGGRLFNAAKSVGSRIWDGIVDGLEGAAHAVGDIASRIWNAIKQFINSKLLDPVRNFSVDLPFIGKLHPFDALPRLATGGAILRGGWATVGDRGIEDVWLPQGAQVSPRSDSRDLREGSGATYTINITAGMGTNGADVGRLVVDAIEEYERFNGAGWRVA